MRLFLCFVFPPMAVMMHGKPISAVFNMLLCLFGWFPGVFHALAVNGQAHTKRQTRTLVRAIRGKKVKPKKPCPVHRHQRTTTSAYDDPTIGEGGTKFKRKR